MSFDFIKSVNEKLSTHVGFDKKKHESEQQIDRWEKYEIRKKQKNDEFLQKIDREVSEYFKNNKEKLNGNEPIKHVFMEDMYHGLVVSKGREIKCLLYEKYYDENEGKHDGLLCFKRYYDEYYSSDYDRLCKLYVNFKGKIDIKN